jgi:hypothetical protein
MVAKLCVGRARAVAAIFLTRSGYVQPVRGVICYRDEK